MFYWKNAPWAGRRCKKWYQKKPNPDTFYRYLLETYIPYVFRKKQINVLLLEDTLSHTVAFRTDLSMLLKENEFCVSKSRFKR